MKFNRTPLRRCDLTHLLLPEIAFRCGPANADRSVLGVTFFNVSKRAVNGRYHKLAQEDRHMNVSTYDAKNICMDERWVHDPALFGFEILSTIGLPPTREHSLDRIDNDGDYVLGNLRWASPVEQARNRGGGLVGHEVGYR